MAIGANLFSSKSCTETCVEQRDFRDGVKLNINVTMVSKSDHACGTKMPKGDYHVERTTNSPSADKHMHLMNSGNVMIASGKKSVQVIQ